MSKLQIQVGRQDYKDFFEDVDIFEKMEKMYEDKEDTFTMKCIKLRLLEKRTDNLARTKMWNRLFDILELHKYIAPQKLHNTKAVFRLNSITSLEVENVLRNINALEADDVRMVFDSLTEDRHQLSKIRIGNTFVFPAKYDLGKICKSLNWVQHGQPKGFPKELHDGMCGCIATIQKLVGVAVDDNNYIEMADRLLKTNNFYQLRSFFVPVQDNVYEDEYIRATVFKNQKLVLTIRSNEVRQRVNILLSEYSEYMATRLDFDAEKEYGCK